MAALEIVLLWRVLRSNRLQPSGLSLTLTQAIDAIRRPD